MGALLSHALTFLLGGTVTVCVIVIAILKNPEKVEKWLALVWSWVLKLHIGIRSAHKRYVQHDFQGRVNDFVKHHSKEMPGFQVKGVKLSWEDADTNRKAFIEADRVVVRVRREDPHYSACDGKGWKRKGRLAPPGESYYRVWPGFRFPYILCFCDRRHKSSGCQVFNQ